MCRDSSYGCIFILQDQAFTFYSNRVPVSSNNCLYLGSRTRTMNVSAFAIIPKIARNPMKAVTTAASVWPNILFWSLKYFDTGVNIKISAFSNYNKCHLRVWNYTFRSIENISRFIPEIVIWSRVESYCWIYISYIQHSSHVFIKSYRYWHSGFSSE